VRPEAIHAFALLSLRALAEYDPVELRRNTDLSKRQIDERIENLIIQLDDDPEVGELRREADQLSGVENESENAVTAAFLARQIASACLQRAQISATRYQRTTERSVSAERDVRVQHEPVSVPKASSVHEEYLRLAVMRLLRDLPEYEALFEYRWKDRQIDCVLQPRGGDGPTVLVEFKLRIENDRQTKNAFNQLQRLAAGWPKSTLLAVLTSAIGAAGSLQGEGPHRPGAIAERLRGRTFLLVYDTERNEFARESAGGLLHAILKRQNRLG
jgi:hypothetical protein